MDPASLVADLDFLRSSAAMRDSLRVSGCGSASKVDTIADCVDCTAEEVVRALRATHSAVALNSAATAGESETRNVCQEAPDVQSGVVSKSTQDLLFRGRERTRPPESVHPHQRIVVGVADS